jgi:hypothetical protein
MGLVRAVCNDENYFIIDGSKANGGGGGGGAPPNVTLTGLVDNEHEPVHLRAMAKNVYEARDGIHQFSRMLLHSDSKRDS